MSRECVRMQASWEVRVSDGLLVLYSALFSKRISVKLGSEALSWSAEDIVLKARALQFPTPVAQAAARLRELTGSTEMIAEDLLGRLRGLGAMVGADCGSSYEPQDRAYDRLARFLASFETTQRSGEDYLRRLHDQTVVLVGLGSYGSFIANCLARLGIKRLIAFDHDAVELSNLDRQILYCGGDVGRPKTLAAARFLEESGSRTNLEFHPLRVTDAAQIRNALSVSDLAINTFGFEKASTGAIPPSRLINAACIELRKPCLNLGGNWCGPFYLPGTTPCYFCAYEAIRLDWGVDPEERSPFVQKRMLYPMVEMTASMGEFDAIGFLSGAWSPRTCGKIIKVNWWGENAVVERVVGPVADCACQKGGR